MRAFYGDRFSPNMTKTPEGFLVCHNVPIARTGAQEYLPQELGMSGDGLVTVHREAADVFAPAAMASFEGKPVTDDHPPTGVDPSNYGCYMRGVVQNVHHDEERLLADLVIHDANLIAEIESGKREISCGYECKYVQGDDGAYKQIDIVGNHVAVVDNGRAGPAVSIQDKKPKGEKKMAGKGIFQKMFAAFVKDADPEEIQEAAKAVSDAECSPEQPPKEEPTTAKDEGPDINQLAAVVGELVKKVDALAASEKAESKPDTLDALEEELQKPECGTTDVDETSVTVPPESIAKDEDKPAEAKADDKPCTSADKAVALAAIRAIKPIVAALPDSERQQAADAMSKAIRDALQVKGNQQASAPYAAMLSRKTADAAGAAIDRRAFGENCAKRNPHHKEGK